MSKKDTNPADKPKRKTSEGSPDTEAKAAEQKTASGRSNKALIIALIVMTVIAIVLGVLLWKSNSDKNTPPEETPGVTIAATPTDEPDATPTGDVSPTEQVTPTSEVSPTQEPTPTEEVSPTPKLFLMPSYLGQDYKAVTENLNSLGMGFEIRAEASSEYNDKYPVAGQIVGQFPAEGELVSEGAQIGLIYSTGATATPTEAAERDTDSRSDSDCHNRAYHSAHNSSDNCAYHGTHDSTDSSPDFSTYGNADAEAGVRQNAGGRARTSVCQGYQDRRQQR